MDGSCPEQGESMVSPCRFTGRLYDTRNLAISNLNRLPIGDIEGTESALTIRQKQANEVFKATAAYLGANPEASSAIPGICILKSP